MLTRLKIQNYALIRELDVDLSPGFSIITGETGAGKSILLGALSLILGQRADSSVLSDKSVKCVVEANFRIDGLGLEELFVANDLDFDNMAIFRRRLILPASPELSLTIPRSCLKLCRILGIV